MQWTDEYVKAFCRLYSNGPSRYGKTIDEKLITFKAEIDSGEWDKAGWLEERIFVDIYGRGYNLSDVPMTHMRREDAYSKRGYTDDYINELWEDKVNEQIEVETKWENK